MHLYLVSFCWRGQLCLLLFLLPDFVSKNFSAPQTLPRHILKKSCIKTSFFLIEGAFLAHLQISVFDLAKDLV